MDVQQDPGLAGDLAQRYAEEKAGFYTGLQGTSMASVSALTLVAPASFLLHRIWSGLRTLLMSRFAPSVPLEALIEWTFLVLPNLLAYVAPHLYPLLLVIMACLGIVMQAIVYRVTDILLFMVNTPGQRTSLSEVRKPFLAAYRSSMMVATLLAILAVDFPIFPRSLAKTEDFGTSIMDLGVGGFLFSNAVVSRARGGQRARHRAVAALQAAVPLIALGFVRVISVKGLEYHEHVSEYGVHWNFFFTLAATSVAVSFLSLPAVLCVPVGMLIGGGYQALLASGAQDFILGPDRSDLFAANKEGIYSTAGYLSLFLLGQGVGAVVLQVPAKTRGNAQAKALPMSVWWGGFGILAVLCLCAWTLLFAVMTQAGQISRRMANLPYVLWTFAANLVVLLAFFAVDLVTPSFATPLARAINRNSLAIFMAGNLMTGIVNMSMYTIWTSHEVAFLVLAVYSYTWCLLALSLDRAEITLKFW